MDYKVEIINKIIEDIFSSVRKDNSPLVLAEVEQTLNNWSYENLIRLEFFMRRKTNFGKYIAKEGINVLLAFKFICEGGGNPEFDENDKAETVLATTENNPENQECSFLSIVVYKRDESYITGEIKARKTFEINRDIASTFKIDSFSVPYPLLCLEKWTMTDLHSCGIYSFNPFAFYQDLNDEVDGSNLRKGDGRAYYVLAWDTDKVYSVIQQINSLLPNTNYSENEKNKIKMIEERLSKHCQSNTIVKFSFYFDA